MPPSRPRRRPRFEELEPRLLLSADAAAGLVDPSLAGDDREAPVEELVTDLSSPDASLQSVRHEVVFVAADLEGADELVQDIRAQDGRGREVEIVLIGPEEDGIGRIAEVLAGHEELDAVHVLSHGAAGGVQLGSSWLDAAALASRADAVASWGDALAEDADLLFYGCDLAGGAGGVQLVDRLAELTGADVAASVDLTGAAALGGDWELELATGSIEAAAPVSTALQSSWQVVLAAGEGTAFWSEKGATVPEASGFDGSSFGAEFGTVDTGGPWTTMAGAVAPTRDEKIVVGVDADGSLSGMMWNGASWSALPFNDFASVSDDELQGLDVAYASETGDAMLVYNNGSSGTDGLSYRTWDGSDWSNAATIATPVDGEPEQIQLAASPASREMVLVVGNESRQNYALVWDGSSWGDPALLDNGDGAPGSTDVAVAYEQGSGRAMVAYGTDTSFLTYRIWNGASWESEVSLGDSGFMAGELRWTRLASDPDTDRIALAAGTRSGDGILAVWDGSAWGWPNLATTDLAHTDRANVAVAFESGSGAAIAAYATGDDAVAFRTWTAAGGWSAEQIGPELASRADVLTLDPDPASDAVMLSAVESGKEVSFVAWDGSAWGAPNPLELDAGVNKGQPFLFLWDAGPSVKAHGGPFAVAENAAAGTVVGTLAAEVGDLTSLSYAIVGGNPGDGFAIDAATGEISVNDPAALDFEAMPGFVLQIEVSDAGTSSRIGTSLVPVKLTDVNEAPSVSGGPFSVAENAAAGMVVGSVSASDPDAGDSLSYAIVGGNPGDAFAIDAATGAITVRDPAALDFETTPGFALEVEVSDGGTPSLTDSTTVLVDVTDVNEAPSVSGGPFSVAENAAAGTVVGSVSASDPDAGDSLSYAIVGGNPGDAFAIDAVTGRITVDDPSLLDSETTPGFALEVEVSDGGTPSLTGSTTVLVDVTDVNEAPSVSGGPFSVAENAAAGTVVGSVSASDPDAGDSLSYAIVGGNPGDAFAIDAVTGRITVDDPSLLDSETTPGFALEVEVSDGGTPSLTGSTTVLVDVTDVNEAPSVSGGPFSVAENAAAGTVVGSVSASDPDAGGSLSYAIVGGNPGDAFAIDAATGAITVRDPAALDFETTPGFALEVEVSDGGTPSLTDSTTVLVDVTDVNEAPSVSGGPFSVAENAAAGTVVGSVSASDPDAGDSLSYAIVGGNPGDAFAIDAATGAITVRDPAALDFETTPGFALEVEVSDAGAPPQRGAATVVVHVGGSLTPGDVDLPGDGGAPPSAESPDEPSGEEEPRAETSGPDPTALPPTPVPPVPEPPEDPSPGDPVATPAADFGDSAPAAAARGQVETEPVARREDRDADSPESAAFRALEELRLLSNLTEDHSGFLDELNRLRSDSERQGEVAEQVVGSTFALTAGLSVGYALLLTRGGWLLASLLSSMPAWRLVDPLPILARLGEDEDGPEAGESLDSLLDGEEDPHTEDGARSETPDTPGEEGES